MAKSIIHVNIKGRGTRPDSISLGDLGELLTSLGVAIRAAVPPEVRIEHSTSTEPLISLVSVVQGNSSDMGMAVADYGMPSVAGLTEAIASRRFSSLPGDAQEAMSRVSRWAIRHRVALEFEEDSSLGVRRAVVSRKYPVPSPASAAVVAGVTTAWGYLLRVGGKEPAAALEFPDGTRLTISGDERVAKELGQRLYENVGIEGVATWRLSDWKMVAFKATRVLKYRPGETDVEQAFKELADASGGRWDGVDAAGYVRGLRGGDAEP